MKGISSEQPSQSTDTVKPVVSIVSPVYQAEDCICALCDRLSKVMDGLALSFEIVLIDDGSRDRSWEMIQKEAQFRKQVRGYRLSRNFGQHYALTAGINHARGDYVVVLDCDLQEPPEEIPKLLSAARAGHDIVLSRRVERKGSLNARLGSAIFYWLLGLCSGDKFDPAIGSLSILSRRAATVFSSLREYHRYYLGVVRYLGFSPVIVDVEHHHRFAGNTSYSLRKRLRLALDGIVIQSPRLLYLAVWAGLIISAAAMFFVTVIIYMVLFLGYGVPGWPSVFAAVLFMGGAICSLLGIVGIYIAKMYIEIKDRPLYIVKDATDGSI